VLSPPTLDFADENGGFVHLASDVGQDPGTIEERHLAAMHAADFAWLHAPEGSVGTSVSLEIGYAHAIGLQMYTDAGIDDAVLADLVSRVDSPEDAVGRWVAAPSPTPGRLLRPLQTYYERVAEIRGYTSESPQDVMLLITEELGELARAIRKQSGLIREGENNIGSAAEELADVQLYVLHLASAMGVDLGLAVTEKERQNSARSAMRILRESA
jgi:NTP pyrophosphatase (non-canonical NTP hydrolase)